MGGEKRASLCEECRAKIHKYKGDMKERSRSSGRQVGDVIDDPMKSRWDAVMDEFTLCGECTDLVKKNWDPYRLALPLYSGCFVLLSVVLAAYIFYFNPPSMFGLGYFLRRSLVVINAFAVCGFLTRLMYSKVNIWTLIQAFFPGMLIVSSLVHQIQSLVAFTPEYRCIPDWRSLLCCLIALAFPWFLVASRYSQKKKLRSGPHLD
ncbi:hypothetical protein Pelo_561 [Pelomyxa schiedti]|nr:hypothetical protein Pelo_561 [Pelomyxa schiedti]